MRVHSAAQCNAVHEQATKLTLAVAKSKCQGDRKIDAYAKLKSRRNNGLAGGFSTMLAGLGCKCKLNSAAHMYLAIEIDQLCTFDSRLRSNDCHYH